MALVYFACFAGFLFEEFRNSSYAKRYELFCRRLVLERHHNSAAILLSESGTYNTKPSKPCHCSWQS